MLTVGRFFFLPHFWETRKKENAEIAHLLSSSSFKRNGKERRGICAAAVSNRKRCIGPFGPRLHGWMERQCEREGMIIGDRYSWRPSHRYALGGLYMPSSLAASSSSSSFSSSVALRVGDWVFLLSSHLEAASPLCFLRINSQCIPWYIHFCVNADHVVTRPHYGLVRFQVDFFFCFHLRLSSQTAASNPCCGIVWTTTRVPERSWRHVANGSRVGPAKLLTFISSPRVHSSKKMGCVPFLFLQLVMA